MTKNNRVIFAGTPEFAVPTLKALLQSKYQVVSVFTQPDRPAGRGRKLKASAVKAIAQINELPIYQPKTLKSEETQELISAQKPDVMVVAAYGLIIPQAVLDIPRMGCVNIHASLLPRWRGAAPIQRAILAGDNQTGITIMQISAGLDSGDILLQQACPISSTDTSGTLHDRLAELGAETIVTALDGFFEGSLVATPQNDALACYANKIEKVEANIDWRESAEVLGRKVRAFNPWPVAQTQYEGKNLRVWEATVLDENESVEPGRVITTSHEGIDVGTGKGVLRLVTLQLPGGKRISATDFINAYRIQGVKLT